MKKLVIQCHAKSKLRKAVKILNKRGLKLASKWAAEQLIGLAQPSTSPLRQFDFRSSSIEISSRDEEYDHASDIELYAKSILDLGEYGYDWFTLNNSDNNILYQRNCNKSNINYYNIFRSYKFAKMANNEEEADLKEIDRE